MIDSAEMRLEDEITPYYGTLREMPVGTRLYYSGTSGQYAVKYLCEFQEITAKGLVVIKAVLDVTRSNARAPHPNKATIRTRAKNLYLVAYQRPELFTIAEPWPQCHHFAGLDAPALSKALDKPWSLN